MWLSIRPFLMGKIMFLSNLINRTSKLIWLIFIFFIGASPAHSYMAVGEKINAKILHKVEYIANVSVKSAISDYRYLVINRGTSDGIYENDHFSFYKNTTFAFRGVVVKSDAFQSMWLTYHNYTPSLLEINSDFVGKKLHFGHIPKRVNNIKSVISASVDIIYQAFKNKQNKQNKANKLGTEFDKIANTTTFDNGSVKVVDKNDVFEFNPDLELEEIVKASQSGTDYFSWSLSASPISFSRVPKTKDLGYSISISCLFCENTSLEFSYEYTHSTEKPAKSDFSDENEASILTSSYYYSSLDYTYNNVFGEVSYWASLTWTRARTADVFNNEPLYSPDYLWSGIPFGLSYNFISTDKIPEFSLSYGIQWDYEKVSFIDFVEDDFGNFNEAKVDQKLRKLDTRLNFI